MLLLMLMLMLWCVDVSVEDRSQVHREIQRESERERERVSEGGRTIRARERQIETTQFRVARCTERGKKKRKYS